MKKRTKIFIIAGEPSGDFLGASLMQALKRKSKMPIDFTGIGGPLMEAQGMQSLIPLSKLSIMGIMDALKRIFEVFNYLKLVRNAIAHTKPDVVFTIDFPGFNLRLGKKIKYMGVPHIHFVAPTVWAWKSNRAEKFSNVMDHLLTLFSFEPPYFEKYGLPTTWVGHPLVEEDLDKGDGARFRKKYKIPAKAPVLLCLPGSRDAELKRHVPVFLETMETLAKRIPNLHIVIPTLPYMKDRLKSSWNTSIPTYCITEEAEKRDAYKAASIALAASGTVTLELALARVPMVMTYKISKFNELLARLMIQTKYFCLVNILLQKEVVPELLQKDCNPDALSKKIMEILRSKEKIDYQKEAFDEIKALLQPNPRQRPTDSAAAVVLDWAKRPNLHECRITHENNHR